MITAVFLPVSPQTPMGSKIIYCTKNTPPSLLSSSIGAFLRKHLSSEFSGWPKGARVKRQHAQNFEVLGACWDTLHVARTDRDEPKSACYEIASSARAILTAIVERPCPAATHRAAQIFHFPPAAGSQVDFFHLIFIQAFY